MNTSTKSDFLYLKNENLRLRNTLHRGQFSSRICIGRYVINEDIITFAVKYYDRSDNDDTDQINRIIEEAQVLVKLDNPHIVQIFGIVESNYYNGSHMLVMELAPLGSLNKYLKQDRSV